MGIYDFTVKDNRGQEVSLEQYRGKVLLVVNTATKCGLTPQYEALQELYAKYNDRGLEILDFPCNQFGNQAPGTDEEISEFCTVKYNTTFPRFTKIDVNGENAAPLYVWLKEQAPKDRPDTNGKVFERMTGLLTRKNGPSDIRWNFCKFLVDGQGSVVARYAPSYTPKKLEQEVADLLA